MSDGLIFAAMIVVFVLLLWLQAFCYRRMAQDHARWEAEQDAARQARAQGEGETANGE